MNREIKFRGKRVDNNEWAYGFPIGRINPHKVETEIANWFINDGCGAINTNNEVVAETVGQFIGIVDSSEREVYKDDLYYCEGWTYKIAWNTVMACFETIQVTGLNVPKLCNIVYLTHHGKHVGNIHDNPNPE